jgi:hypothetical protein
MGRPLKIQKYGTAQGITYPSNTTANTPAAGVPLIKVIHSLVS